MSNESDRKPYTAPAAPTVVSTLSSAAANLSFSGGSDYGIYTSAPFI